MMAAIRSVPVRGLLLSLIFFAMALVHAGSACADPLAQWQWKNPLPQGNAIRSVAYGANTYVAVGATGTIITSADGVTWVPHKFTPTDTTKDLNGVVYGNKQFMAVGAAGTILTSADGSVWTDISSKYTPANTKLPRPDLKGVTFGNNCFYAVGTGGTILSSTDGTVWKDYTNTTALTAQNLNGIVYSNYTYVAVGDKGTVLTLLSKGVWQAVDTGMSAIDLNGIASDRNNFITVGDNGTILSSSDGIIWTQQGGGSTTQHLYGVSYGTFGGVSTFVATGGNGAILTSSDRTNWTVQVTGTNSDLYGAGFGANLFVAVGGDGVIRTSTVAGDTWNAVSVSPVPALKSMATGNGIYVAVGKAGQVLYSLDGNTWTSQGSNPVSDLNAVAFGNNQFVAVGNGGIILNSTDGINWTANYYGSDNFGGVVYDSRPAYARFVAVGDAGTIVTSSDLITWLPVASAGTTKNLSAVTLGNGVLVAIGQAGTVLTSVDGATWTVAKSPGTKDLRAITVAFKPDGSTTYLVVGAGGTLSYSTDLTKAWTSKVPTAYKSVDFNGVACDFDSTFSTFVAVGAGGVILTSPDAQNWTARPLVTANDLTGAFYMNRSYWAVSRNGIILNSNRLDNYIVVSATRKDTGASISTNLLDFGVVDVGQKSFPIAVKISNSGQSVSSPLIVTSVLAETTPASSTSLPGVASSVFKPQVASSCGPFPLTIRSNGSCTVEITFSPTAPSATPVSEWLNIISNDSATPYINLPIAGTGGLFVDIQPGPNGKVYSSSDPLFLTPLSGLQQVSFGSTPAFIMTPDPGYYSQEVVVDGVSLGSIPSYTFSSIGVTGMPRTLQAFFSNVNHLITATGSPIAGGSVTAPGVVPVNDVLRDVSTTIAPAAHNATVPVAVRPSAGYHLDSLLVDGATIPNTALYTFPSVTANHSLEAIFKINSYPFALSVESNGAISGTGGSITAGNIAPLGACTSSNVCNYGSSVTFTMTAKPGYRLTNVFVDGASIGPQPTYTFQGVDAPHSIKAVFTNLYQIAVTYGGIVNPTPPPNGSVSVKLTPNATPLAPVASTDANLPATISVPRGALPTVIIKALDGYNVQDVKLGGPYSLVAPPSLASQGDVTSYTFPAVVTDLTLDVTFVQKSMVINVASDANGQLTDEAGVPLGTQFTIPYRGTKVVKIVPKTGFEVDYVKVDGVMVGAVSSYVFADVTAGHTIEAHFRGKQGWVVISAATTTGSLAAIGSLNFTLHDTTADPLASPPASVAFPLSQNPADPLGQVDPSALQVYPGAGKVTMMGTSLTDPDPLVSASTLQFISGAPAAFTVGTTATPLVKIPYLSIGVTPSFLADLVVGGIMDKQGNPVPDGDVVLTTQTFSAPVTTAAPAGGLYPGSQAVVLTASPANAEIHYTLDGSPVGPLSRIYTAPIQITANTTLRYAAWDKINNNWEATKTAIYSLDKVLPTAVLSGLPPALTHLPAANIYVGGRDVVGYKYKLWLDTTGTPVLINELQPTFLASTPITLPNLVDLPKLPLMVDGKYKLEVYAQDTAGNWQTKATVAQWTLNTTLAATAISPTPGVYNAAVPVTLVNKGATIYYTLDGTDPSTNSLVYTAPIPITQTTTVKYRALDSAGNLESVRSATYTVLSLTFATPLTPTTNDHPVLSGTVFPAGAKVDLTITRGAIVTGGTWSATAPDSYTLPYAETFDLYAWAKDAAGNVSASLAVPDAVVTVDSTKPTVDLFTVDSPAPSLTAVVSGFTASDDVAIPGHLYFLITETASVPAANATGWSATAPTSYTFSSTGTKTLYAWAKDATGNVSSSLSQSGIVVQVDATKPVLTGFTLPAAVYPALRVPVTSITATDDVGVTGYILTESATPPSPSLGGWTAVPPTSYTFASEGPKTLYAWAKDVAGNVSDPVGLSHASVVVSTDSIAPVVTDFTVTSPSVSLAVEITAFSATDNADVTGYRITESAIPPMPRGPEWSPTRPTSYTFATAGASKTLYAWAVDAAGNVSASMSALVDVSADLAQPTVTGFAAVGGGSLTVPVTLTATDDDPVGLATGYLVTHTPSGLAPAIPAAVKVVGNAWSYDLATGTPLTPGINTITATVTSGGYTFSRTAYVRVELAGLCSVPDGDVDRDGQVTLLDVAMAMRIAIGLQAQDAAGVQLSCGDVYPAPNQTPSLDGQITINDALFILQKVMGINSYLP